LDVEHKPVLVAESTRYLGLERGGIVVDCTLGLGGHAEYLLESYDNIEVVGIDQDAAALALSGERLQRFGGRLRTIQGNFGCLSDLLDELGVGRVAARLADLGVSSMQLDQAERGFSFQRQGPLDMRMGGSGTTAADIVNTYSEVNLQRIFKEYGEETRARRIAAAIVQRRSRETIATTQQLRRIVLQVKKGRFENGRRRRIDPATKVFQALRIEVNQELQNLDRMLEQGIARLEPEGRIVIISYHSLEDRIVKNAFRDAQRGEVDPVTGRTLSESQLLEVLTRKPVRTGEAELAMNPRARSARLRAARRL
jgi:16S rRNA (cytosine1402-N4)-methyltransferase